MSEPPTPRSSARLLLVLSSERSGSTLLRVMLGRHSQVVAPSELFLMRYPGYDTWRAQKPVAIESVVELFQILRQLRSVDEIDASCRGLATDEVYRWLVDRLAAGSVLIDKTPAYANSLETLQRSRTLDPYYVWLIRHPLAVIESHVRIKRRPQLERRIRDALRTALGRTKASMDTLARLREMKWLLQQSNIRSFLAGVPDDRHCAIHFEDLVADPGSVLHTLCTRLGLPFQPAMLDAADHRNRKMHPALGDPNFHLHDRVEREKATAWQATFAEADLGFETRCLMQQIGVRNAEGPAAS